MTPKAEDKIQITSTRKSCIFAAILTGALLLFTLINGGSFFEISVEQGGVQLALSIAAAVGAGAAEAITLVWPDNKERRRGWWMVALFALLPVATLCMMEFLNGVFIYNWSYVVFFQNYVFMLFLYLLFFAIFGNIHTPITCATVLCYVFGMVNHFVSEFRGTPFVPSDIISAKTGLSVAGSYSIVPDNQVVLATALFVLILVVAHKMRMKSPGKKIVLTIRIVSALLIAMFCALLYHTDWYADHNMKPDFFNQARGYRNHGSMLHFFVNTKYLTVQEPKDYSAEEAGDIVASVIDEGQSDDSALISDTDTMPNIICVMNETLSDLHVVGEYTTNEDYLPFLHSLSENTIKGYTHPSVYGAGTANSEFEFLTGDTMAFLPTGACAYESYVKRSMGSLVSSLNTLGYTTTAFHPYYGENWDRSRVYPLLGFDKFVDISDLFGEETVANYRSNRNWELYNYAVTQQYPDENVFLRRYVSDSFDFHMLQQMLAQQESDGPSFMFNVTMQNHSGYTGYYSNFSEGIFLTGDMAGKYPKVDQYLSLLKYTDTALAEMIDYYSKVDEPTIICVFGDHQPSVEQEFYEELYGKKLSQLSVEEEEKMYQTPFIIWANYDIPEATVDSISLNYLSTLLMQTANLPMTGYQKYLAQLRQDIPTINAVGYCDSAGNWYTTDDTSSPWYGEIENYRKVQYNNLFDKKNCLNELFTLSDVM